MQDCFLVAFSNHRSADQSGDLGKLGNCPCPPKCSQVSKQKKIRMLMRALRYAQVCNNNNNNRLYFSTVVSEHQVRFNACP